MGSERDFLQPSHITDDVLSPPAGEELPAELEQYLLTTHHAQRTIGIYGGSFDPIHNGHIDIAMRAVERYNLAGVVFIPAHVSPFKTETPPVSGEHRLKMVELAIKDIPGFEVSGIELARPPNQVCARQTDSERQRETGGGDRERMREDERGRERMTNLPHRR